MNEDGDTFVVAAIKAAIRELEELDATVSGATIRKILVLHGMAQLVSTRAIEEALRRYSMPNSSSKREA